MRTVKLLTVIGTALTIQSCNMAKHYANLRIDHENETAVETPLEIKGETILVKVVDNSNHNNLTDKDQLELRKSDREIQTKNTEEISLINNCKAEPGKDLNLAKIIQASADTDQKKKNENSNHKLTQKINKRKIDWGGLLAGIGYTLLGIAIIFLVIFTWSSLAAFWIILGTILAFILGICIGISLVVWTLIELFFETF